MKSNISPTNLVLIVAVAATAGFYYLYTDPTRKGILRTPVLGQSNVEMSFEDLTVIAKMPFLTFENQGVDLANIKIDDSIFYIPQVKTPEPEEVVVEDVAVYAPAVLDVPAVDYASWASSNLSVQLLSNNGVIINDVFYKKGDEIISNHVFEDGSAFKAVIRDVSFEFVVIQLENGGKIKLALKS